MPVTLELYSEDHAGAARRFNTRLRECRADEAFLLPESEAPGARADAPFSKRPFVLMDGGEARGGVLLQEQDFVVGGAVRRVINIQSPVTEGLFNSRHAHLGVLLIRRITERNPFAFAVGMGGLSALYPAF